MKGFPTLFWPDTLPSILVDRWHPHHSWSKFKSYFIWFNAFYLFSYFNSKHL